MGAPEETKQVPRYGTPPYHVQHMRMFDKWHMADLADGLIQSKVKMENFWFERECKYLMKFDFVDAFAVVVVVIIANIALSTDTLHRMLLWPSLLMLRI